MRWKGNTDVKRIRRHGSGPLSCCTAVELLIHKLKFASSSVLGHLPRFPRAGVVAHTRPAGCFPVLASQACYFLESDSQILHVHHHPLKQRGGSPGWETIPGSTHFHSWLITGICPTPVIFKRNTASGQFTEQWLLGLSKKALLFTSYVHQHLEVISE